MKRTFIILLSLVVLAGTARAQFVVSAHIGGAQTKGTVSTASTQHIYDSVGHFDRDTLVDGLTTQPTPLTLTGGIKFGYQVRRLQFGISGSFSWAKETGYMTPLEYRVQNQAFDTSMWSGREFFCQYTETVTNYTIAPYVRYECIQIGDVALFVEFNGYYANTAKPQRRDTVQWEYHYMQNTIDTNYTVERSSHSFGGKIVPGMTWQLSPHCHVELYLDILAFTFDRTISKEITVYDEFDTFREGERRVARRTTTTTNTTKDNMGFGITGSPLLSNRNWVRVGFSFTF